MKKANLLLLAAGVLAFASCTRNEAVNKTVDGQIVLGAGISNVRSRASVDNTSALATADNKTLVGIFGAETANSTAATNLTTDWGPSLIMNNVRTTNITTDGQLSWADLYVYPREETQYVKFCAYYPHSAGVTGFSMNYAGTGTAPVLNFTIDGQQDLMWAQPVIGSRAVLPGNLVFGHKLTQLQFELIDNGDSFKDTKVTAIRIESVNTKSTMNVETGVMTTWNTTANIDFPAFDPTPIPSKFKSDMITLNDPAELAGCVMLEPGLANFKITVSTDNKGDFDGVVIKPVSSALFDAGTAYVVTLRFKEDIVIEGKAEVTQWLTGTGEGVIQ